MSSPELSKSLILTVGLPRSGKSTWAKSQNVPIVCPDSIRLALHGLPFVSLAEPFVWAIAKVMVRALFISGHHTVILDACNTTQKRRDEWKDGSWVTRYKFVHNLPLEEAKELCQLRCRDTVSDEYHREGVMLAIDRMAEQFEPLTSEEKKYEIE